MVLVGVAVGVLVLVAVRDGVTVGVGVIVGVGVKVAALVGVGVLVGVFVHFTTGVAVGLPEIIETTLVYDRFDRLHLLISIDALSNSFARRNRSFRDRLIFLFSRILISLTFQHCVREPLSQNDKTRLEHMRYDSLTAIVGITKVKNIAAKRCIGVFTYT